MSRAYPPEVVAFIAEHNAGRTAAEVADLVNATFGTSYTVEQIKGHRARHHLISGLTGRFEKGMVPYNKGVKRGSLPGQVATQFKAGHLPHNHKPVGSERVNVNGYLERKIAEPKTRKPSSVYPSRVRYNSVFEYMFVFSKGRPRSVHLIADRVNKHAGDVIRATERQKDGSLKESKGRREKRKIKATGVRHNVWDARPAGGQQTDHPAVFPARLVMDHIISWSNPDDVVLDPFMGSGTTAVAAIKTGRRYIGFECSAEYCETAQKRIEREKQTWQK